MTDIVERLRERERIRAAWGVHGEPLCGDAADEIERLRAWKAEVTITLGAWHRLVYMVPQGPQDLGRRWPDVVTDEINRLRTEVAELKARLDLRDSDEWQEAMEQRRRRERDIYHPQDDEEC